MSDSIENEADAQAPEAWADGPYLVVRRNATLPSRCIKTNSQETIIVEQTVTRLHVRLLGLALFGGIAGSFMPGVDTVLKCGVLFIAIGVPAGAMLTFPRVRVGVPVCRAVVARRRLLLALGWALFAIGMTVYGIATLFPPEQIRTVQQCMLAVFVLVGSGAAALYFSPFVGVERTDGEFTRLTGVGCEYLASLPPGPQSPLAVSSPCAGEQTRG